MKQIVILLVVFLCYASSCPAQEKQTEKPKLIIGIVVDQMRFDHLYKYEEKYTENGFKRLLNEGFNYKNAHYNYVPTVTASGHASIYTGTTPSVHGIIGNGWYDRYTGKEIENIDAPEEKIIGTQKPSTSGASPGKLLTTTVSDQLRMHTNMRSKVISISLKDRGAILPGGHLANAAYWYDWQSGPGYFVSSSYYMDALPDWVSRFNKRKLTDTYLDIEWNTLYPIARYTESLADNNPHERAPRGKETPVFPYDFKSLRKTYRKLNAEYQLLMVSPYGNTLVTQFAKEAIKNEQLGADTVPDMLLIGYSATDVAGHVFGPQSVELEDIYLRLDMEIAELLSYLDAHVGKGTYTLFLSSDHGAIPVASYLHRIKIPTGIARINHYKDTLAMYLNKKYGTHPWVEHMDGEQVYLNRKLIAENGLNLNEVQQTTANFLVDLHGISGALSGYHLQTHQYTDMRRLVQNGYHQKRSGDVFLTYDPGFIQSQDPELKITGVKGTTHGSGYNYNTHIPLLWYGLGIPKGEAVRNVAITDIASTLSMLLNIQLPSGNTGHPLKELFSGKGVR